MYKLQRLSEDANVMVVGCGGTGGFVAEGLCRIIGKRKLWLVDHDRVEERNLGRQNFYRPDLGRFKSQVLAERLSRNFNRPVNYCTLPIQTLPLGDVSELTIGCVDNPDARRWLQYAGQYSMGGGRYSYCKLPGWYIDSGNSEHSGQVLIGNALPRELRSPFKGDICERLPLPTLQQPALLAPQPEKLDCATAVEANEQSRVINQAMAALVLQFVDRLISGDLTWMGAYLDLEAGTLSTVPATPEEVSRITGMKYCNLKRSRVK